MSDTWKPVLSGVLRAQALEAAEAIVTDIAHAPQVQRRLSLLEGHSGMALFFEAASRMLEVDLLDRVGHHLQLAALETLNAQSVPVSLHSGLSGLGWVAAHLSARHPDLDVEELCGTVDEALTQELERTPSPYSCDIRDGVAGMGLYALERLPHPTARRLLERMVALLEESAEHTAQGLRWPMPEGYLGLYGDPKRFTRGVYTLGLAHGIPGAMALLAAAHAHGISRERAAALLEGGFAWFTGHVGSEERPDFPLYLHGDERFMDKRFSWCVGSPGITAVLWWAARTWGHPGWQARMLGWAEAVAREAMDRRPSLSANLCCGTSGTALLFLRLFHATRRPVFEEAAVRWFEHTLALRQPGQGPGGYCFEQNPQRPDNSLQFGAAGIALALLAASTSQEPDWDQPFLFSLQPRLLPEGLPSAFEKNS